jgi:preprotein translocase subunit SecG
MFTILIVVQGVLVMCMILLVLMQKTSTDGMANLAGSGQQSMHASGSNSFVRKGTMFFAIAFILNSLIIAKISYHENNKGQSLIESINQDQEEDEIDE